MQDLMLFFSGWQSVLHAVIVGGLTYLTLVVALRVLGKSMLMQTSAASLIVSSALGNGLATVVLTPSIPWAQAMVGFLALMLTQLVILWLSSHSLRIRKLIEGSPVLVFYEGQYLESVMIKHGLSDDDIRAAIRRDGLVDLEEVGGVVYEIDGKLNIVPRSEDGVYPILEPVGNYPPVKSRALS